jgi:DNA-binding PadR family transcriptional regulator
VRSDGDDLLLGEWACLGLLCEAPAHGFAVAARLRPDADIGRIWSMSRALTYRSLDQLAARSLIRVVGEEPGVAGGTRTVYGPTRTGRSRFHRWVLTPVPHLRDLRSELLVKIVLGRGIGADVDELLVAQRARITELVDAFDTPADDDVVARWRHESAHAALRFVDAMLADER